MPNNPPSDSQLERIAIKMWDDYKMLSSAANRYHYTWASLEQQHRDAWIRYAKSAIDEWERIKSETTDG